MSKPCSGPGMRSTSEVRRNRVKVRIFKDGKFIWPWCALSTTVSPLLFSNILLQGVTKRCRPSWLTNSALVHEPKCGGRGALRGLSQWVQLYTGSQINFGDLTPYLTSYVPLPPSNLTADTHTESYYKFCLFVCRWKFALFVNTVIKQKITN